MTEVEHEERDLLADVEREYYDISNAFTTKKIYNKLKLLHPQLTHKRLNTLLNKQFTQQLFAKRKTVSDFNLVIPKVPFGRVQMDLLDLSNKVSNRNHNMKWVFVLIDSYTKLAFARSMKTKETKDCLSAFISINEEIWDKYNQLIQIVDCDNEAAFKSHQFQKYCNDNDIKLNFSRKDDSRSKAFVERFNRYLRDRINKSMIAFDTNNWTDSLQSIIDAYNTTQHHTTGVTPENAVNENSLLDKKIDLNRDRQQKVKINIGDKVRVLLQTNLYSKGTDAKWSRDTHVVEKIENGNRYYVSGRENYYKDYELLPVSEVRKAPSRDEEKGEEVVREEKKNKVDRRIKRALNKESVDPSNEEKDIDSRVLRKYKIKSIDRGPYLQ